MKSSTLNAIESLFTDGIVTLLLDVVMLFNRLLHMVQKNQTEILVVQGV